MTAAVNALTRLFGHHGILWLPQEYFLKVLATPHEENTFVDLLDPNAAEGDHPKRRRRSSAISKMAPTRFVSKYMVHAPPTFLESRAFTS